MKVLDLIVALETLPDDAELVKNKVGNLAVIVDGAYTGWVDLQTGKVGLADEVRDWKVGDIILNSDELSTLPVGAKFERKSKSWQSDTLWYEKTTTGFKTGFLGEEYEDEVYDHMLPPMVVKALP